MSDGDLLQAYDDAAIAAADGTIAVDHHLAGLRAIERAARAAERDALIAEADATLDKLRALHHATMGYEDACVARGAELVADALRARAEGDGEKGR